MNCIFCKIANSEIKTELIYEDDKVVAFNDLNPQAPHHILVIPKEHVDNIFNADEKMSVDIHRAIKAIVEKLDLYHSGFRVVVNTNRDAGQSVDHLHYHILAGRSLTWPPG